MLILLEAMSLAFLGVMAAILAELVMRMGLMPQLAGIFQGMFIVVGAFVIHQTIHARRFDA